MKQRWVAVLFALCLALAAQASAEKIGPTGEAALYVVVGGEEVAQVPLGFVGEAPSATELFDGLTALTGYSFSVESTIAADDMLIVIWAEDAGFLPGAAEPVPVETVDLSLSGRADTLQFMLDSALWTLRENLDVDEVYFGTVDEAGLFFEDLQWVLGADEPYTGDFARCYVDDPSAYGCARDVPATLGDSGGSLNAEDALGIVTDDVLPSLEPPSASGYWTISHLGISTADDLEGHWLEIGWDDGDVHTACFRAIVGYEGGIHLRAIGDGHYARIGSWAD